MSEDKLKHAREQGQAQFDSIKEMVAALDASGQPNSDDAMQAIHESALSVEVRTGWHMPGDKDGAKPSEYQILLCTGGPACRLVGELNEHLEPESVRMEVQDWYTPWTTIHPEAGTDEDGEELDADEIMMKYAQTFWFGE